MKPLNDRGIRLLVIGSEITQGFVNDTNTRFICSEMFNLGISVKEIITIPDNLTLIKKTIKSLLKKGDFLITTGGLGPTDDDLTIDALCSFLKVKPVSVKACEKRVQKLFFSKNQGNINRQRILSQCRIPAGAEGLPNTSGLAPGVFLRIPGIISLPGFPEEIKSIWPHVLKKITCDLKQSFLSHSFNIWGVPESIIYESILIPKEVQYGNHSLPWGNNFFLKSSSENKIILDSIARKIEKFFQPHIIDNPLNQWFEYLKTNQVTFSTIESCTGGLAAKLITDFPGASDVYPGSIVTYDNRIKTNLVNVNPVTISQFGAVSRQTACEMARGGSDKFNTDITISITGIAGPAGGSPEKPVGTVYFGIYNRKLNRLYSGHGFFPFGRERFRNAAVYSIYLSLFQLYIFYKDDSLWLNSPQGKNFNRENVD
jgi:nicotinamide-nucleotide amidase